MAEGWPHGSLHFPYSTGGGADLLSLVRGYEGMVWNCISGSWGRIWGKRFFTNRVVSHWKRVPREVVTAPRLSELKEPLDKALSHINGLVSGSSVRCRSWTQWSWWVLWTYTVHLNPTKFLSWLPSPRINESSLLLHFCAIVQENLYNVHNLKVHEPANNDKRVSIIAVQSCFL